MGGLQPGIATSMHGPFSVALSEWGREGDQILLLPTACRTGLDGDIRIEQQEVKFWDLFKTSKGEGICPRLFL